MESQQNRLEIPVEKLKIYKEFSENEAQYQKAQLREEKYFSESLLFFSSI